MLFANGKILKLCFFFVCVDLEKVFISHSMENTMNTNYSIVLRRISALMFMFMAICAIYSPQSLQAQPGHYDLISYGSGNPYTASNGAYIGGMQAGNYLG